MPIALRSVRYQCDMGRYNIIVIYVLSYAEFHIPFRFSQAILNDGELHSLHSFTHPIVVSHRSCTHNPIILFFVLKTHETLSSFFRLSYSYSQNLTWTVCRRSLCLRFYLTVLIYATMRNARETLAIIINRIESRSLFFLPKIRR